MRWAQTQIGHRENGTSNCSPRITRWLRDMGISAPPCQAWCGAFVHQAYKQAGVKLSRRLIDPDKAWADARSGRRGLKRIDRDDVKPGDIMFFKYRTGVRASHVGIVVKAPNSKGIVETVEGNVGHRVQRELHRAGFAVGAARVTR